MTKSTITREPITHYLKIYPEFFSAVCTGVKRAELRKNDRDYRVGDTLHLMETPRGSCHQTGEFINVKITHTADVGEWMPGYVLLSIEREAMDRKASMDSEPVELPLDYLQGHKDGLEWAAQLAEANHPETGDWLYDDLIELAKAIRKGPDMPPVLEVDADDNFYSWFGREWEKYYQPSHYSSSAKKHLGAIAESAWYACRAAMLQAEPVTSANKLGNSPVIPDTWIPVSERLPEEGGRYWCYVEEQNSLGKSHYQWNCSWNGEIWGGAMMYGRVTHWMPLPAVPQEVKGE